MMIICNVFVFKPRFPVENNLTNLSVHVAKEYFVVEKLVSNVVIKDFVTFLKELSTRLTTEATLLNKSNLL